MPQRSVSAMRLTSAGVGHASRSIRHAATPGIIADLMRRLLALLLLLAAPLGAQEAPDIIRGRVLGPDSLPREGVRVTALSLLNQSTRSATTDRNGRYTIVFPGGGGDYLVTFQLIGMTPMQQQVKRLADEDLLVLDVAMNAIVLETITATAERQRPPRVEGGADPTGSQQTVGSAGVPLSAMGDISAMVSYLPGVTMITGPDGTPIGFSVLGLGPEQNTITLDGVTIDASTLPADVLASARLTTTTFDPSRGGFSGANVSVSSRRGGAMIQRSLNLTVDEPSLQFIDRTGSQLGREYTQLRLQGATSGPIIRERLFYALNAQVDRRTRDLSTLLNTPMTALEELGAPRDSVTRLRQVATEAGIPLGVAGIPDANTTLGGSLVGRLDLTPQGQHAVNANFNLNWRQNEATSMSALALPSHGGEDSRLGGTLQFGHSTYFGSGVLTTTRATLAMDGSEGSPYVRLPDARVSVQSGFADERPGSATFQLGGNSGLARRSSSARWQVGNSISWISMNNAHRLKLEAEVGGERYEQRQESNRLGTFRYNSLEEFEQGRPAEFSRQLSTVSREGSHLSGWVSLGDSWRRARNLQFQYGLRLEWNRYGTAPMYNPQLEELLGVRNDVVPNAIALSPRFGFSYTYGTGVQIEAFEGAVRGPRATIRGGIGLFRQTPRAELLQSAIGSTGLPSGVQTLNCRGSAVPTPDWDAWYDDPSLIPDECTDGTTGTVFADRQPSVTLFSPDYSPSRSWRANLAWSGSLSTRFRASVEGTYSLNLDQGGWVDLNFRNDPQFALADEGGRPVFVLPSSIDTANGGIASRDARVVPEFSQVREQRSDLRSRSAELRFSLSPLSSPRQWMSWRFNYVFSHTTELGRGFGGSTAGDPLAPEWSRGRSAPHQFNAGLTFRVKGINLGLNGRLSSGVRYTPMISGDVNGDGFGNDRAFIHDPDATADPALADAMRALLASAPEEARDCLRRQLGAIAGRQSCTGPWSMTTNISLRMNPLQFRLPRRTSISLDFNNPLTGLDLLFNGENLRGWGQSQSNPESTLLYVRGFDPDAQRFIYEVNPRFGDTRASRALSRSPFQVTVSFRMDLAPDPAKQILERELYQWQSGSRRRPPVQALRQRYIMQYLNPFQNMVRQRDSLRFTKEQSDSLVRMNARFAAALDSLWTPHAEYVSGLPERFDIDDVYDRMREAQRRSGLLQQEHARMVRALLTDEQFRRLPPQIANYLDERMLLEMQRAMGTRR